MGGEGGVGGMEKLEKTAEREKERKIERERERERRSGHNSGSRTLEGGHLSYINGGIFQRSSSQYI